MSLQTIEQVRRVFRVVAGFTLLAVGVVMLVTPGPGWLVILFGLSLLAAEFIWARRLRANALRTLFGAIFRLAVVPPAILQTKFPISSPAQNRSIQLLPETNPN